MKGKVEAMKALGPLPRLLTPLVTSFGATQLPTWKVYFVAANEITMCGSGLELRCRLPPHGKAGVRHLIHMGKHCSMTFGTRAFPSISQYQANSTIK